MRQFPIAPIIIFRRLDPTLDEQIRLFIQRSWPRALLFFLEITRRVNAPVLPSTPSGIPRLEASAPTGKKPEGRKSGRTTGSSCRTRRRPDHSHSGNSGFLIQKI